MKQYQVNDDYKVLLKKDFGDFNHNKGDHWNFEVQTVGGGRTIYHLHIYIGADGNILPFTAADIYIPKGSPFKK